MSRLRASIRRRLRRVDSPPVPRSRGLSGRGSPTAAHLPAIPEGAPASVAGAGAGDMQREAEPDAVAAPAEAVGGVGGAAVAAAASPAAAAVSQPSHASLEEVDLSEPRQVPARSPSRRLGLACACFAGGRPVQ